MSGLARQMSNEALRSHRLNHGDKPDCSVCQEANQRQLSSRPAPEATPKAAQAAGKPRMDLVPWDAVMAVAEHFGTAAAKYEDRDWEEHIPEYQWSNYIAAIGRHYALFAQGEDLDEKGFLHVTALATNALMLLAYVLRGHPGDNRPTTLKQREDQP